MRYVTLLSGGIDSAVALAHVMQKYPNAHHEALFVNYGQSTETSRIAATDIATVYGVPLYTVVIIPPLPRSAHIPDGSYEQVDVQKHLYVPNRNMILISLAAAYAWPQGVIVIGIHSDTPYADQSKQFLETVKRTVETATYGKVTVEAPLIKMSKPEIIRYGHQLGVPFHLTYSCYKGYKVHCGRCAACLARKQAFRDAGVPDPTEYES